MVGIADLAEEVARFHGYNNIPVTLMRGQTTLGGYSPEQELERALGACAVHAAMTRSSPTPSFPPPATTRSAGLRTIPAASPSRSSTLLGEDTSIMRTTVLPSMLEILTRN